MKNPKINPKELENDMNEILSFINNLENLDIKTLYYLRTDSVIKGDLGSRTAECVSCDG